MIAKAVIAVVLVFALVVILLAVLSIASRRRPELGVVDGRLTPCPDSPNCVSSTATDEAHLMAPIPFEGSAQQAIGRLKRAALSLPRATLLAEDGNYLRFEFRSGLFRFIDDVEFLVDPDRRLIDFRAAARVGRSDFGASRRRMQAILAAFQAAESNAKR